jgi:cysteine desulfurase / selenocysteine lyase
MSTDTTSTNNGSGKPKPGASGSNHHAGTGAQELRFPFATFPMPDPATLERLANEFFLVMPQDLGNGDSHKTAEFPEAHSESIPTTMLTEEMLPLRGTEAVESVPSVPGSLPSSPPGPLTETDLRAIASSLAGATAFVPGTPGTAPTPPAAGSPPDVMGGAKVSPFAGTPTLSSGMELFSFPAVPATASPSILASPPAGADAAAVPQSPGSAPVFPGSTPYFLEGEKGTSPAAASVLPPVNDLFSFPRIPALPNFAGPQTVAPQAPLASPPLPSSASATVPPSASGAAAPGPVQSAIPTAAPGAVSAPTGSADDVKAVTPQIPSVWGDTSTAPFASSAVAPGLPSTRETEKAIYPGTATLPTASGLFSFPGIPGMQSTPGVPVLPSSLPTQPTAPETPSVPNAALPVAAPNSPSAASLASAPSTPAPPQTTHLYEFQPNVIPDLGIAKRPLDARLIRRDFPILEERVHARQLIWLDNAATTQKPNAVIDRISYFYRHENSNIHRAAHTLAARATDAYESAREKTRRFLNASTTREIIFVRGTTEGINLIAKSWGGRNVQKDDEIVITWLEHHANIVPWQQLCSEKGARLRVAPVNDRGEVILEEYEKLLGPRTRLVSFSQVSNALGTITPAREMVEMAHRYGARVLVDGAQAVSHMRVDVQALNCDFFVFSGHKVFGPTGIGAVYGKLDLLENMPPWQGGGNMIVDVKFEETVYQSSPARFEAGTGNIADAVGLGAALDYVEQIGMENIAAYEHDLLDYGTAKLLTVPGLRLIGTAREKASVLSFVLDDVRSEDVGAALNQEGIAVRSGHHCAQPILRRMGVESTVRPSLAFYNTRDELDQLVSTLMRIQAGRSHRTRGQAS